MKEDNTLLITGATGMIGGSLVRGISEKKIPCQMILPVRSIAKAKKLYRDLMNLDYQKLVFIETQLGDICPEQFPMPIDAIIHCACITQSQEMITHPIETADSIVIGTKNVLELARKKQVNSMVYVSSMEVYGKVEDTGETVDEDQLGDIDLHSPRSCYPMGKRMAEHYCHIYYHEHKVPVKIVRLAQTFGRGVRSDDNRVYMQFAHAVREGRNIILRTQGTSMGNYCGIDDAITGILKILEHGRDGEAYNVVNEENTMTIREMAELVAKEIAGGRIHVTFDIPEDNRYGYAARTGLRLSGKKLENLGWKPRQTLVDMYRDMLEELDEQKDLSSLPRSSPRSDTCWD